MYYEHVMKELTKMVNEIDILNVEKSKIDIKIKPDRLLYNKLSKDMRSKIKSMSHDFYKKENELIESINKKNNAKDWSKLLGMKLKLSKLDLEKNKLMNKFKEARKKHYGIISPEIKKKRHMTLASIDITEKIFERIRKG